MKRSLLLLLIMICLGVIHAPAQLYRYLETEDGLSSRRVISIEKDLKGHMWFLTHEGIDRYNGKQNKHYKLSVNDFPVQLFPNLNNLYIDSFGDIWITGKNGYVFKYNTLQDTFDLTLNVADSIQSKKRLPLTHTSLDKNNHLWFCTKNAQYIYHIPSGKFTQLESPIQKEINFVTPGKGNQYYIGTNTNVLIAELQDNNLSVKTDSLLEKFHVVQQLYYHEPTNSLVIGTLMDGFYIYDQTNHTLENIGNMKDVTINAITPAYHSERKILIATDGNGVYELDMKSKNLQSYLSSNQDYSNKMNGDIIKDIYIDEEGRIWMAVFPYSVTVFSDKYPEFKWMQNRRETDNSQTSNQITCLLEDSDGDLWMATSNGIRYYNTRTKQWKEMLTSQQQDKHEQNYVFISLCEPTPGTILVGGYMSGMYRINKKDMTPQYFTPQAKGNTKIRPDKYIRSIYKDEEGNVWAGGYYNFKCINPTNGEVDHYSTEYPITYITSKNKEELWIGTINGLYKFNKESKQFQEISTSVNMGNVTTIYQDGDQYSYIGTHGTGMWIYNNQTKELTNYHTKNSALLCNNIYCILPSTQNDELIISTENELACFNTQEKIFLSWTKEQGLPSVKFNTASGIRSRKGDILFGSNQGTIILKGSFKLPKSFQSKLVLSDLDIHYQHITPGMENSPLSKPLDETGTITLKYNQNIFSINVSSINYDCPSRILYSWKLEGFYDEWTKPSESHLVKYTNISPGKYNLKIRAILLDDGHIIEERDLQIIVKPPFYQTIWAYLIYIIAIVLISAGIIRFIWMRKNENISKEKIQFFINTAHDIRTPLTLIKAPLDEISQSETLSDNGKQNLNMAIRSTDKLSELATKLIEFQKEELYSSVIKVTKCELNSYIEEFLKQFKLYAEKKNINLQFEGTGEQNEIWIDCNKIDSILHNLVSNALKYTPEGGQVSITVQINEKHWFLSVADTGIGISNNDQKKLFKHLFRGDNAINLRITGTGIGLLQTYKLIKRHQGKVHVTSKEGEGTTFKLRFPIRHKKYRQQTAIATEERHIYTVEETKTILPTTTDTPTGTATLLLVEDNTDLRNFLRQSLSKTYQIMEAENGQEALDLIATKQPDLVLSDVMMPVMRGDDLCRTLKSNIETSHIPVILLTALHDKENIIHGLEIKADNYIVKPFDVDILKASIASILANKKIIRQRFAQLNYQTEDLAPEVPGLDLDREFISKVTETIRKNLSNEFNVDSLCAAFHMSRSSFYNKIKALTNQSPSDFARQIRMHEASVLLKSQKYTVAEVSDLMGYSDPKYFTDIFKKHYGMTPSAYMKQEKK